MMNTQPNKKASVSKPVNCGFTAIGASYRGFSSIDQEMEREIAMTWFTHSVKTTYSQRNFLLKKETIE